MSSKIIHRSASHAAVALLVGVLAACGTSGGAAVPTAAPAPTEQARPTAAPATPASLPPTAAPTEAPITAPTEAPTTAPTEAPTAVPATPVYLSDGRVIARSGLDDLTELGQAPEGALAATLVDDSTLLIVRESGLERVNLADGTAEEVVAFDRPAMGGTFHQINAGALLYAVVVSEPESVTPFGMGTRIGSYDVAASAARPLLAEPQNLELLGVTADGAGMLTLPRGQDPAFGVIQVRSLDDGALIEELQVPGEGFARVSPDGRWAAVSSRRFDAGQEIATDELLLYDLTARPITVRTVALPQGGAASGGIWGPDGSRFFFSYGPGNVYMLEGSYGLWGLDPDSLAVSQVADVDVRDTRIAGIGPDGTVLLRSLTTDQATLIGTASGTLTPTVIPPGAILVGWR
ncbi:MAG TPA: PT domain-containing protein [Roseiflexaceae bacterium]|nr:PT domain-containing protein [Roseiflexaceae bacterium]